MAGFAMNDRRKSKRAAPAAIALFACVALAGCHGSAPQDPAPLAGARIGGPFTLTDQDGHRVSNAQFAGKYRLIYFGYTYCPDVCPTTLQHLGQGLKLFEQAAPTRAAHVQPIFITVDPDRDTPPVLKSYVAAFHPRLIGLTGSPAEIAAVAKDYAVSYHKQQTKGASGYLVDHMSQPILFGPDGQPIALVPGDQDGPAVEKTLDQWVK